MDDEEQYHLDAALMHLHFLRDLLWRTGKREALATMDWPYGSDWSGTAGEPIYAGQLHSLFQLLSVDISVEVEMQHTDVFAEWEGLTLLRGHPEAVDTVCCLSFSSPDPDTLLEWQHFLVWMRERTDDVFFATEATNGFLWAVAEPSDDVLMDAWRDLLSIWEVQTFYGHVADARAWRRLRGFSDAADDADRLTPTRDR